MAENNKPPKNILQIIFGLIGDLIIAVIRLWKLRSPAARREFLEEQQEKQRLSAVKKKLNAWEERGETPKISPIRVRLRAIRMRVNRMHRTLPTRKLMAVYLGPLAALSIIIAIWAIVAQPKIKTTSVPSDPGTSEREFSRMLKETATLITQKRIAEAEKNLEKLRAINPDHPSLLTHSGAVELLKKNYPAAEKYYLKALEAKPDSYVARYNLAEIAFVTKNYADAEKRFAEMQKNDPNNETLAFRLFLCTLMQNHMEDARMYYSQLSRAGRTPAWYYATAALSFREKKDGDAYRTLDQARLLYADEAPFYDSTFKQLGFLK